MWRRPPHDRGFARHQNLRLRLLPWGNAPSGLGQARQVRRKMRQWLTKDVLKAVHAYLLVNEDAKVAARLAKHSAALESAPANAAEVSEALVAALQGELADTGSHLYRALHPAAAPAESVKSEKKKKKRKVDTEEASSETPPQVEEVAAPSKDDETLPQIEEVAEPEAAALELTTAPAAKKSKQSKHSNERFQRVKSDHAVYADERLRDMSYAAKVRS